MRRHHVARCSGIHSRLAAFVPKICDDILSSLRSPKFHEPKLRMFGMPARRVTGIPCRQQNKANPWNGGPRKAVVSLRCIGWVTEETNRARLHLIGSEAPKSAGLSSS